MILFPDWCGGQVDQCEPLLAELLPCCCGLMDVVIYHDPACGTSRNALALIRHAGFEPQVVEYLKTTPVRSKVV